MRRNDERWKELCRQAAVEQDPLKLRHLIKQINEYFDCFNSKQDPNPEALKQKDG